MTDPASDAFKRCLDCIGHELTRDECFYAGSCLLQMRSRLTEWITKQNELRGRPLTDTERLNNLRKWLQ
jgi:hypothetical protein